MIMSRTREQRYSGDMYLPRPFPNHNFKVISFIIPLLLCVIIGMNAVCKIYHLLPMHLASEPHADVFSIFELRMFVKHMRRMSRQGRGQSTCAHVGAHDVLLVC